MADHKRPLPLVRLPDRPRFPRTSLSWKITLYAFIPGAVILFAIALVNYRAYEQVTEDLVVQRNRELARLQAGQLAARMEGYQLQLSGIEQALSAAGLEAGQTVLGNHQEMLQTFDGGILVLDHAGLVKATLPGSPQLDGQDWSRQALFLQMTFLREPHPVVSDIFTAWEGGPAVVAVAVPIITGTGRFTGAVAGLFRVELDGETAIHQAFNNLRLEARGSGYLVDGNGKLLFKAGPGAFAADSSGEEVVRQVLAGKTGAQLDIDAGGERIVAGYAPIPGARWGLVTQERMESRLSSSQPYRHFLLLLLGLGLVVPALLVTLGLRRAIRPLAELALGAQEVADGKFGRVIETRSGDEVEALADQFNSMSRQLQDSYALLEQRVAARTHELATLNGITAVVSGSLDLQQVLELALEQSLAAMEMPAGAVLMLTGEELLELMAQRGLSAEMADFASRTPLEGTAAGEAVRSGRPVVRETCAYPPGELRELLGREGLEQVVSLPLTSKGQLLGVMNLCSPAISPVTPEQLQMLGSIGSQVGVAIENARLYEQAEQSAALAERDRLARELHDAVSQSLFSAGLIAEVLPGIWERDPEQGRRMLEEVHLLVRGALAEMRTLLVELRPSALEQAGLGELVRQLGESTASRTPVQVSCQVQSTGELPFEVKVAFYRICQEALNNVVKHAHARRVELGLRAGPGEAELSIRDDGCGFDPQTIPPGHLGLGIIRDRAKAISACLELDSRPGEGTHLKLFWREAE
jgi:nitrate/nitrite-specific signal transduction histidine kinase